MANKKEDTRNELFINNFGVGKKLTDESLKLNDIISQTSEEVRNKFGKRVDNKIVDTATTLNLSSLFNDNATNDDHKNNKKSIDIDGAEFKDMMQENSAMATNILASESGRLINYSNYRSIVENINEMAFALDTYVSNILSPDDYTKSIFSYEYANANDNTADTVVERIRSIIEKYGIEEKTEQIVSETLTCGDCFVSVLPYNKEFAKYLVNTTSAGVLNESMSDDTDIETQSKYLELLENIKIAERTDFATLNESDMSSIINEEISTVSDTEDFKSIFGEKGSSILTEMINKNINIKTVADTLKTKAEADLDIESTLFSKNQYDIIDSNETKGKKKSKKKNDFYMNGSSMKILEPERVVALEVDNVCYGYYYIEPGATGFDISSSIPMDANSSKNYVKSANPMNPSLTPQGSGNPGESAENPVAKKFDISDEKLSLVSNVLLKALSKKLKKKYISENKQFKDLLYNLLKQKYIFEKGISITYFLPEEIIHFKAHSIFENIIFFAKIYLGILTNTVLIKMGRGHDKRIFYINSGSDNNHEQSIFKVMQDVKTKEFKMSSLGSIGSVLSLNPGAFDDIYMPQINGERPVDIDILPGMDQDINNDFLEFLRKSMLQGTGIPYSLLGESESIDFAKQITSQNANFCRKIIRYQNKLTPGFDQLIRTLYKYEYQYTSDGKAVEDKVDINKIKIKLPSPGTLNLENMLNQFTQVENLAEYITKRYIPDKMDQSNVDEMQAFKFRIVEKLMSQVNWKEYSDLYDKFKEEYAEEQMLDTIDNPPPPEDNMGGY